MVDASSAMAISAGSATVVPNPSPNEKTISRGSDPRVACLTSEPCNDLIDAVGRLTVVVIISLGAFYTLRALNVEIGPLLGALGVGALFIAVGLQPLLVNVVGSVILQTRRPFRRMPWRGA